MSNGDLVPDDVIIEMVKERLSKDDVTKGFLMDGFPRTVMQADALDKMLNEIGRPLDAALFINVAEDTIVRRLSHRRVCRACGEALNLLDVASETKNCLACSGELYQRDDDSEQVIRKRLQVYRQQTEPVVELYKKKGFLRTVEVQDHYMPEDTFRGVKAALGL
jgi:adenylate kinase